MVGEDIVDFFELSTVDHKEQNFVEVAEVEDNIREDQAVDFAVVERKLEYNLLRNSGTLQGSPEDFGEEWLGFAAAAAAAVVQK